MFKKLVAIEPVNLIPSAEEALHRYAREVVLFGDVPKDDAEIIRRIGDADAVLLSYLASQDAKLDKLFEDPTLLRTPIVRNGKQATVGYCPDVWNKWE